MTMFKKISSLIFSICFFLAGCSGDSADGLSNKTSEPFPVSPSIVAEVNHLSASGEVTLENGATITVNDVNNPINGTEVVIPKTAVIDPVSIQVGYDDVAPGPFRNQEVTDTTIIVSKTLNVHVIKKGVATFNDLVYVTMPYDAKLADGIPPIVVYWDESTRSYQAVTVISSDKIKGTVTFATSHFSKFMAVVVSLLKVSAVEADTGFRVEGSIQV